MAIVVPVLEPAMQWYSDIFGFVSTSAKPFIHTPAIGERWKTATEILGEDISEIRFARMRAPGAPFMQMFEIFELHPKPPQPEPGKRKSGYVHASLVVGDPTMTAERISASRSTRPASHGTSRAWFSSISCAASAWANASSSRGSSGAS